MATDRPALASIRDLEAKPSLWYRLHVFLYDLRHYQSNESSKERLEILCDAIFIGDPYFNDEEARLLKSFPVTQEKDLQTVMSEHISDKLNRREKKRIQTNDHRICAAHDLAPLLEKIFDIRPKDLQKSKSFRKQLQRNGLDFAKDEKFVGLGHRKGGSHS